MNSDPAAIFAASKSLWETCHEAASSSETNLSELFNGVDELMRECLRIATTFEEWACSHVCFEEITEVWPYFLEEQFGSVCLEHIPLEHLASFRRDDSFSVSLKLKIPLLHTKVMVLPLNIEVQNPNLDSEFKAIKIQTVHRLIESNSIEPFTKSKINELEHSNNPFYAIYGRDSKNLLIHISDQLCYENAHKLCQKLFPGINFPKTPPAFHP